tara:strand:- start:505 stop:732 length:228 start_codon:yes stop_codon:yes gene_type:complete
MSLLEAYGQFLKNKAADLGDVVRGKSFADRMSAKVNRDSALNTANAKRAAAKRRGYSDEAAAEKQKDIQPKQPLN